MRILRLVIAALIPIALVVVSFRTTSNDATVAPQVPCAPSSLGGAFSGQMAPVSFQKFGCEGKWAFAWATVGTGLHAIGVTEVLSFDTTNSRWHLVSRLTDCKASILPSVIYHQGCFSN
jgi:hypothetical protein